MNKIGLAELAVVLVKEHSLSTKDAEAFIQRFSDVLNDGLHHEKQVKVKGLGTFKVTNVSARESVDVNTGKRIVIDSRSKISFTPDASLRELVNKPFSQFETVVVSDGVDFSAIDQKYADTMQESTDEDTLTEEVSQTDKKNSLEPEPEIASLPEEPAIVASQQEKTAIAKPIVEPSIEEAPIVAKDILSEPASVDTTTLASLHEKPIVPMEEQMKENSEADVADHPSEMQAPKSYSLSAAQLQALNGNPSNLKTEEKEPISASPEYLQNDTPQADHPMKGADPEPKASVQTMDMDIDQHAYEKQLKRENSALSDINDDLKEHLDRSHRIIKWMMALFLLLILGGGTAAFFMFKQLNQRDNQIKQLITEAISTRNEDIPNKNSVQKETTTVPPMDKNAVAVSSNPTSTTEKKSPSQDANAAISSQSSALPAKESNRDRMKDIQEKSVNNKEYNSDPRVRTGAWIITGVAQTVTVKKGQTLATISRTHLGPGMECYVEAINGGITEVKEGQKIKIPSLRNKKARK
ncbi:MAG TPA: hypothetical protein DIS88_09320 [Prevotella sp.]|nr:hypothetical protein [Prevotella sp.]